MSHFTPNESQPSELTLQMIRTLARLFPIMSNRGEKHLQHLN